MYVPRSSNTAGSFQSIKNIERIRIEYIGVMVENFYILRGMLCILLYIL